MARRARDIAGDGGEVGGVGAHPLWLSLCLMLSLDRLERAVVLARGQELRARLVAAVGVVEGILDTVIDEEQVASRASRTY